MKTLTWKVDKTIPTACPDYKPDPYTGEYPSFHCAVYHSTTITEERTAEFSSEKEAKDFASKAPLSCYDFKLNGKLLKDKRKKPESIVYSTDLVGNGVITTGGSNAITAGSNIATISTNLKGRSI